MFALTGSAQTTFFPFGSTWKYKDDGSNQGTVWKDVSFNDAGWLSGAGQLGFGDGDEATILNACGTVTQYPSCTNKYITSYFRKNVTIADISSIYEFQFNVLRDDGMVLYVNGVEVIRNNMPTGTITSATLASAGASDDGNTIQSFTINAATAGFVNGVNTIAVEIHQNAGTSSDLTWDMELKGLPAPAQTTLISMGGNWKYKDNGSNQNTAWIAAGFDDSSWSSGNGQFGYGDGDETTILNACGTVTQYPSCSNKYITSYYRKSITIPTVSAFSSIQLNMYLDDGAVVYINGQEVYRYNMPTGTITYTTAASTATSTDGNTILTSTLSIPASFLVAGTNQIAVEVHQNVGTSSDLTFDMEMLALAPVPGGAAISRGPYLQTVTSSSIILHWKTDVSVDSKVTYGTDSTNLNLETVLTAPTQDHIVQLNGLSPFTKYFYSIGSSTGIIQSGLDNYFVTAPISGTEGKYTFWVNGDCGTNSTHQKNVRDRYIEYMNGKPTHGWLLLGDNAYNSGTESEYTNNFFNIYQGNVMKNMPLWPVLGNHDYANSATRQNDHAVPYFDIFDVPSNGQAGGVPSNTEAFYSYDYGNVHFLALDSYGKEDNATRLYDTLGAQVQWIKADLLANTKPWVVAYWHHAPYTMGSHNSDSESELVQIRQKFIRILERNGVDLILCGHSHDYERSKLMKGHYGNESSFDANIHNLSQSSGKYDGTSNSCTYLKDSTHHSLEGTVYVLGGSSGQLSGTQASFPHAAMPHSNATTGGSLILQFEANRMDAKWLCNDGVIRDNFTIIKHASKRDTVTINYGDTISLSASWVGNYSWSNGSTSRSANFSPEASQAAVVTDQYQCVSDTIFIQVIQPTLTIQPLANTSYCVGSEIQVPYTVNGYFNADNNYRLELSDENGSFASPLALDTIAGNQAGFFSAQLPTNLPTGSYSIRIVTEHPQIAETILTGIQINELPIIGFTGLNPSYIVNEPIVSLTGNPAGGTFSGTGISSASFNPAVAGVGGPYEIVYAFTDANGCFNTDTMEVVVNVIPSGVALDVISDLDYCLGDSLTVNYNIQGDFNPSNTFELQLSNATGDFTLPTVLQTQLSNTSGTFFTEIPASLVAGSNYQMRIVATNPSLISSNLSVAIQINALPAVSFTGLNTSYFDNEPNVTLTGIPAGGTFSGPGVNASVFSPVAAGIGTHQIVYGYSDLNTCFNSDTNLVTVVPVPPGVQVNALTITNYCVGDPITVDYTMQGSFASNNLVELQLSDATGGFVSPTILGSQVSIFSGTFNETLPLSLSTGTGYLLRVVASNPNVISGSGNPIQISELPIVVLSGLNPGYVETDPNVTLIGTPAGGTFSGPV
ncbi:metallophosphoesterase [Fluviicola sp.]|uniref:metallophosphoesterase n=1 Tax=Fluviicola sp. TaxID=1917219 RepID=UPI003D271ED1